MLITFLVVLIVVLLVMPTGKQPKRASAQDLEKIINKMIPRIKRKSFRKPIAMTFCGFKRKNEHFLTDALTAEIFAEQPETTLIQAKKGATPFTQAW